MKFKYIYVAVIIAASLLTAPSLKAEEDHEEHEHGESKAVGPGKAISEVSEKDGFKLSNEALSTMKVKFKTVGDAKQLIIDKETLVSSKNFVGIYRFRDGFFKFIQVKPKKINSSSYSIETTELNPKDQIVTGAVGLIRITDVYSTDTAEYGHGH